MAIQYAGGVTRNDLYTAQTDKTVIISNISTSLAAAGWTSADMMPFALLRDVQTNPLNNETVTLDGKVYTFKTVINNANNGEVLIGLAVANSLANLKNAVNLGPGSGTAYSSATTLNTNLAAAFSDSTSVMIMQKVLAAGPYNVSETLTSGSFSVATTSWTGKKFTSATTPQFLTCCAYFYNAGDANTGIRWAVGNTAETYWSGFDPAVAQNLFGAASQDIRVIACKYQAFVFIYGAIGSAVQAFAGFGVPWIPDFLLSGVISGATNATPIVITTSAVHGYTTGDSVTIRGVLGNTAANVTGNTITVLSTTTFSLDAVAGNGAYTSGGRVGKLNAQIVEAVWAVGSDNANPFIRSRFSASANSHWTVLNGAAINTGSGTGCLSMATVINANLTTNYLTWYDTCYLVTEPLLCWGPSAVSQGTINGQLWDAMLMRKQETRDVTGTADSHNWFNLTDFANGGSDPFWGAVLVVVP